MPVIMLTMKTERLNSWATTVAMPRPTRIDRIAMSTGISPATTAPKTSIKMTMAMGRPKSSSPCLRSLADRVLKSLPTVCSAGDGHREPAACRWRPRPRSPPV